MPFKLGENFLVKNVNKILIFSVSGDKNCKDGGNIYSTKSTVIEYREKEKSSKSNQQIEV